MADRRFAKATISFLLLAALALAGCAGKSPSKGGSDNVAQDVPKIDATSTTGGIRGVVVDDAVRPIKGVLVQVTGKERLLNATTSDDGQFALSGLEPGTYLLKASQPLYSTVQQSVDVVAGVSDPPVVKVQLLRTVFAQPYLETLQFKGFIACSQDFNGQVFSEECGQGPGVPCGVPVVGCQRVGGQTSDHPQFNFNPSSDLPKSMVVELSWTPNVGAATSGAFWTVVAKDFVCDPTCGGDNVMNYDRAHFGNCAKSPSYIRDDANVQTLNLTAAAKISTFTWACGKGGTVPYDLELNQQFDEFVTMSYYLPLPDGWSFIQQSPAPF